MPTRTQTYALDRDAPFFLERGVEQVLVFGVRHGFSGGLVAPTSGVWTLNSPSGSALVSGDPVVVSSSTATVTVTPGSSVTLGTGWDILYTPTWDDGTSQTIRCSAVMCKYVPPNVVSARDLYRVAPELQHRIPQSQRSEADGGDGTGWQPQIDRAYWAFLNWMMRDGRKPWLVREVTGYKEWVTLQAALNCVQAISYAAGSDWAQKVKDLAHDLRRAEANMRLQYDDEDHTLRRGRGPTSLAPVGRPLW